MMLSKFIETETNNNENTVTNLLYGMMQHKYMRDAILRALTHTASIQMTQKDLDSINFSMISIQSSVADGGIADLCIDSSECFILIENKIRQLTPLQEYQTTTYPRMVAHSRKKVRYLIFLLPDGYHVSDSTILEMCQKELLNCPENLILFPKWSSVIRQIEKQELGNDNPLAYEFLLYINNRLSLLNENAFERKDILTMMNPSMIQRSLEFYVKMKKLIEDADIKLRSLDNRLSPCDWTCIESKSRETNQIGKYLNANKHDYVFWIGYHMESTLNNSNMFLCVDQSFVFPTIQILNANDKTTLTNKATVGYRFDNDPDWIYFPIENSFLEEEDWSKNVEVLSMTIYSLIKKVSQIES